MDLTRVTKMTRGVIRAITVSVMSAAVVVATAAGFAQSYAGLYRWGLEHRLSGWKAESFPLLVDVFILVGELGLFLLALDGFRLERKRVLSWLDLLIPIAVASAGWLVSLWFNVGHIQHASNADKVTAGVPPVTAMIGLLILFRTIHRYVARAEARERDNDPQIVTPLFVPVDRADSDPEPEPLREPEELPALPSPLERPLEQVPAPRPAEIPSGLPIHNPKWPLGVGIYLESLRGGNGLSQRLLADRLDMKSRALATAVIKYVTANREEAERIYGGHQNDVSQATP